ncbi:MAG: PAS domain S-box protein [Desulfomonile tiedjei]|nr:PAS domain S-box protein [Desulfomonile tiedjei]
MRDEDKTREELLSELSSLREELLHLRCIPKERRSDSEIDLSSAEWDDASPGSFEPPDWDLEDSDLPTIDDLLGAKDSPRILDTTRHGPGDMEHGGLFSKDVTESGSFDLRWLRLASFAKLLEAIPMPILMVDLAGFIQFANKAFLNLTKDTSKILGSCIYSFFPDPDAIRRAEEELANVFLRRTPAFREGRLNIDGTEIWCRMSFRSIRFGTERSVLVLIEDLTTEKRELNLNKKYKKLVTVFPIGIAEFALVRPVPCDLPMDDVFPLVADAKVTGANIEFAKQQGLRSVDDLRGASLHDVFPVEAKNRQLLQTWVQKRLTTSSLEWRETAVDGESRFFEITLVGIIRADRLVEFWGMRQDITERKRVQEELVEKIRIIDELYEHVLQACKAKAIEEHTGKVAHELRQPLAIIGGFARRMVKDLTTSHKIDEIAQKEAFQIIIKEIERLEDILRGLVEYTERGNVHLGKMNPNRAIQHVLDINAGRLQEKNIRVEANLDDEAEEIVVDAEGFEQVVRNLLANAVEASVPGELIRIETGVSIPSGKAQEVGLLESDAYFEMKIEMHGKVMPPDELQKIFNPFVTTKDYGTGIGLTLAKKIVEDHKGSISVKSNEEGTLFTVWLPMNPRQT